MTWFHMVPKFLIFPRLSFPRVNKCPWCRLIYAIYLLLPELEKSGHPNLRIPTLSLTGGSWLVRYTSTNSTCFNTIQKFKTIQNDSVHDSIIKLSFRRGKTWSVLTKTSHKFCRQTRQPRLQVWNTFSHQQKSSRPSTLWDTLSSSKDISLHALAMALKLSHSNGLCVYVIHVFVPNTRVNNNAFWQAFSALQLLEVVVIFVTEYVQ